MADHYVLSWWERGDGRGTQWSVDGPYEDYKTAAESRDQYGDEIPTLIVESKGQVEVERK